MSRHLMISPAPLRNEAVTLEVGFTLGDAPKTPDGHRRNVLPTQEEPR